LTCPGGQSAVISLSSGDAGYRAKEKEAASSIATKSYATRKTFTILMVALFSDCPFLFSFFFFQNC